MAQRENMHKEKSYGLYVLWELWRMFQIINSYQTMQLFKFIYNASMKKDLKYTPKKKTQKTQTFSKFSQNASGLELLLCRLRKSRIIYKCCSISGWTLLIFDIWMENCKNFLIKRKNKTICSYLHKFVKGSLL